MAEIRLGPYRLERVLGTGSFATVWLAYDEVLDRRVAVKILADNWSQDNDVRRRFLSEARLLLTIESPRVVRGFHLDETDDGQPYLVMAWADRGTLGDRLDERVREGRAYEVDEVIAIATEIAAALRDVHQAGHLHRDVKPTNVLLRSSSSTSLRAVRGLAPDERLVLADFGLARGIESSALTLVAGSPAYMAPEQATGLTQLDGRADLFALGRIMLEMLTGDPGGRATTVQAAAIERFDVRGLLHADDTGAPPELVDLIVSLTDDEPEGRPASADEVVTRLEVLAAGVAQGSSRPTEPPVASPTAPPAPAPAAGAFEPPSGRASPEPVAAAPAGGSAVSPSGGAAATRRRVPLIAIAGVVAVVAAVVLVIVLLSGNDGGDDPPEDPGQVPPASAVVDVVLTSEPGGALASEAAITPPPVVWPDASNELPGYASDGGSVPPDRYGSWAGTIEEFVDEFFRANGEAGWQGAPPDIAPGAADATVEMTAEGATLIAELRAVPASDDQAVTEYRIVVSVS